MTRYTLMALAVMIATALLFPPSEGVSFAESLNPEGINPHAEAPRKRISVERKIAATEARKKKQAEIAVRKAGQPAQTAQTNQGATTAGPASDMIERIK